MKKIMALVIIALFFPMLSSAEMCNCEVNTEPASVFYEKQYNTSDIVFFGKLIDKLMISPALYVAVFEETELLKGQKSRIKMIVGDEIRFIRYILSSEINSDCYSKFQDINREYIVIANGRSKNNNLFATNLCGGTTEYSAMTASILRAEAARHTQKPDPGVGPRS